MTYQDLIRRCLLEEAERSRLSPALAREITSRVMKGVDAHEKAGLEKKKKS